MSHRLKRVVVTGAAGQIAYSLIFRISNGELFGPNQPIALHLLDLPLSVPSLKGVEMELHDCVFPLLKEIKIGSEAKELFAEVDYAFLVGAKPRGPGMERKDLLAENGTIFVEQGKALNAVASRAVRVLVVGNPCNTNCLIAKHHAPDLSPNQFFAMTQLDHNRTIYQLANKAKVGISEVSNMTIWGNHSSTQVPDFFHAKIGGKLVTEIIQDRKWLEKDLIEKIQKRGAEVIGARGKSSAASAANAALGAMRDILYPTPKGDWFSMGVYSKGNPYGINENLYFSFPCRSDGKGDAEMVTGLEIDPFLQEKIEITQKELLEEREMVAHLLR
jgi:malate dehydrogenase